MVICPIAKAVHCTGCPIFKFCPLKTSLGDYVKVSVEPVKPTNEQEKQAPDEKSCRADA